MSIRIRSQNYLWPILAAALGLEATSILLDLIFYSSNTPLGSVFAGALVLSSMASVVGWVGLVKLLVEMDSGKKVSDFTLNLLIFGTIAASAFLTSVLGLTAITQMNTLAHWASAITLIVGAVACILAAVILSSALTEVYEDASEAEVSFFWKLGIFFVSCVLMTNLFHFLSWFWFWIIVAGQAFLFCSLFFRRLKKDEVRSVAPTTAPKPEESALAAEKPQPAKPRTSKPKKKVPVKPKK